MAGPSPTVCYVSMIIKGDVPWRDARVRQAMNYAADKESIVKYVLEGHGKVVPTVVSAYSYGYNPNIKPFPHDPARAKKLLAEAGYPNGFTVDMDVPMGRYVKGREAAEALAGQIKKVGVTVNVKPVEWGHWVNHLKSRWEPHVKPFWSWACRSDSLLHSEGQFQGHVHGRATWTGFRDKEVDKLIDSARAETDDEKRLKKYRNVPLCQPRHLREGPLDLHVPAVPDPREEQARQLEDAVHARHLALRPELEEVGR
ncbi:ABC transporter substrate-binding protein [Nitrospinota bacterium]